MIIKNIVNTSGKTHTSLSADLIFRNDKTWKIFFRVENKYKDYIYTDASPFLAALLFPCMKQKENIEIQGTLSKKVINTIPYIMNLAEKWNVGFKKISIKYNGYSHNDEKKDPSAVGCFFTGGVDSFYTYLKNKKEITHLILIHGCDVPLSNKLFFSAVKDRVNKLAEREKVKILIIESNFRQVLERFLEWEWNLGGALGSVGLFLRNGLKKLYIPGGMRRDQLCPYGTHPDLDPLWSAEKLKIIHDGCEFSRLEKVLFSISKSPLALENLRVCCHYLKDHYNCNKCFKCVQTKIELLCADALIDAKTFDNTLTPALIEKVYYNNRLNFHMFGEEALEYLRKKNKNSNIQHALERSLQKSKSPSLLRQFADLIALLDKKYNRRRLYYLIFGLTENQDRTLIFKIISNLGLVK